MAITQPSGKQIKDGTVQRVDLDVSTAGQSVIAKLIAGVGLQLTATGGDAGTGDVTADVVGKVTTIANANYTILSSDRYVRTSTTAFTATRTFTLPAANSVPGGTIFYIGDDGGAIVSGSSFYLNISRAGTDLIQGNTTITLVNPFSAVILCSNGNNGWSIVSRSPPSAVWVLTSGTSITLTAGTKAIFVECIAGGGGGGGALGTATPTLMAAAGGGGGGYAAKFILNPQASYNYVIGASGTAGGATGTAGGAGGNTTFGTSLVAANGGGGGPTGNAGSNTVISSTGASGGAVSGALGDLLMGGGDGGHGFRFSGTSGQGGAGGEAARGGGGGKPGLLAAAGQQAGSAGANYGGGGGGGISASTTGVAGGAGAAGCIILWEFY